MSLKRFTRSLQRNRMLPKQKALAGEGKGFCGSCEDENYARFFDAKSQFTSAQNASRYFGRALR